MIETSWFHGHAILRIVFMCLASPVAYAQAQTHSVRDGVYSDFQAKRGEDLSGEECARCHSASLLGGENNTPPLVGDAFLNKWRGRALGDLFQKMAATMPTDSPGRLTKSDYIDILAFILSANNYPAGAAELKSDINTLNQIKIEP